MAGVASQAGLRAGLARLPMWAAVERRFPGTLDRAAAAAWTASTQGANDGEVRSAARAVLAELVPAVLAHAPDASLDEFAQLFLAEIEAARAVSPQACSRFVDSRQDTSAIFAPALLQRDAVTTARLFAAPPVDVAPVDAARALQPVLWRLTPRQIAVVRAPKGVSGEPELHCEALRVLYRDIVRLAPEARHAALRALFSGPA